MRRILFFIFLLSLHAAAAGAGPGSSSFDFMNIHEGAREAGIGNASAISRGANAVWWNPAGLAYLERATVNLSYNSWFDGIARQRAGYSFLMQNRSAGAVNLLLHSVTGIDGYDWHGTPTSELKAASYAVSYSQARRFSNTVAAGLSIKGLFEILDEHDAWAACIDAGVIFEPADNFWISAGVKNAGASGSFIRENEPLPFTVFTGLGLTLNRYLLISADLLRLDGQLRYGGGVEAGLWGLLFFRGGWNNFSDISDSFHLGAGWRFKDITIDYAYAPFGDLGTVHRVDLTYEFGSPPLIENLYRMAKRLYSAGNYREAFIEFGKVHSLDPRYKQIRSWLEKTRQKIE